MQLFCMQRAASTIASHARYFPEFPSTRARARSLIPPHYTEREKANCIIHTIIRIPSAVQRVTVSGRFPFAVISPRLLSRAAETGNVGERLMKNRTACSPYRTFKFDCVFHSFSSSFFFRRFSLSSYKATCTNCRSTGKSRKIVNCVIYSGHFKAKKCFGSLNSLASCGKP